MKTKARFCSIAVVFLLDAVVSADGPVAIRVLDESSAPIASANVRAGFVDGGPSFPGISGLTDARGLFEAQRKGARISSILVSKHGYYNSQINFADSAVSFTIVLKRIGRPVPLFVWTAELSRPVDFGVSIAFDFEAGDWCEPFGKGRSRDISFVRHGAFATSLEPFDVVYTISFANADDGLQETRRDDFSGSSLVLAREAPQDGYASTMQRRTFRVAGSPIKGDYLERRAYFLRVRSTREAGGAVVANYVKVLDDFVLHGDGTLSFQYYYNPKPGDRNLEFDTRNNLFGRLPSGQFRNVP